MAKWRGRGQLWVKSVALQDYYKGFGFPSGVTGKFCGGIVHQLLASAEKSNASCLPNNTKA